MGEQVMGTKASVRSVEIKKQNEALKTVGKPSFWQDY